MPFPRRKGKGMSPELKRRRSGESIYLFVWKELRSSRVKEMTIKERWARIALKLLVADCPYRPVLCISPGNPFTDRQIAKNLMVPHEVWMGLKKKLVLSGEIEEIADLGIRYADWRGLGGTKYEVRAKADTKSLPATEEELRRNLDIRVRLVETFNVIAGSRHMHEEYNLVKNVAGRVAEGASERDLDIGMRTYLWASLNSTPDIIKKVMPYMAFQPGTFWKWLKMNRPAPPIPLVSTRDYIIGLPSNQKKMARKLVSRYHRDMKLWLRVNGCEHLYDVDYGKVKTCKHFVMEQLAKAGDDLAWT